MTLHSEAIAYCQDRIGDKSVPVSRILGWYHEWLERTGQIIVQTRPEKIIDIRASDLEAGMLYLSEGSWRRVLKVDKAPHPDDAVMVKEEMDGEGFWVKLAGYDRVCVMREIK